MNEQKPCGCGGNNIANSALDPFEEVLAPGCDRTVSKEVCVEADVTIRPTVDARTPIVNCVGGPSLRSCAAQGFIPSETGTCTFSVSQVLCVNVPIHFDAEARVVRGTVACGTTFPEGNCQDEPSTACTFSQGRFRTDEELTAELLASAPGGQIVLGIAALGFSFTVASMDDVDTVYNNEVPTRPMGPGLAAYNNLYIQLLAANLNVLNNATCPFAETAIAAANAFLASGVVSNDTASTLGTALDTFNNGNAAGCPEHCE